MRPAEAVTLLDLGSEGAEAFLQLCQKGCEAGELCGLMIHLTAPSEVSLPEKTPLLDTDAEEWDIAGQDPPELDRSSQSVDPSSGKGSPLEIEAKKKFWVTRSGLEISGGFAAPPASVGQPTGAVPAHQSPEAPKEWARSFKSRELIGLAKQLKNLAEEIRSLFGANLANRSQRGSPVLALTLPDRLSAYAEHVILALLVGTSPATRATTSTSVYKAPRRVNLRPLDSVKGALGGTEVRRLRPLQKKATRTAARLRQLQATEAYEIIVEQGPAALLSLPEELDKFASTTIPEMMKVPIGPKRRPDTVRLLWRLFDYVCNTSGGYHDRLVATILDERGFMLGPSEDISDSSLRKWRDQHDRPEG